MTLRRPKVWIPGDQAVQSRARSSRLSGRELGLCKTQQQVRIVLIETSQGLPVDADGLRRLTLAHQLVGIALTAGNVARALRRELIGAQLLPRIEYTPHAAQGS